MRRRTRRRRRRRKRTGKPARWPPFPSRSAVPSKLTSRLLRRSGSRARRSCVPPGVGAGRRMG
eukprot:3301460-Pyramimonas_sp.AAC.1